ncbi:MAG: 2-aminoethylphosphonate aminotransferase [Actinomycetota bacterium]|nr:2-aminoethylphosphonate aminotransferase [Actinomycetota bacterium]
MPEDTAGPPILLNPGPVNLSARVRQALLQPDLCHREAEYFELQDSVRAQLLDVYGLPSSRWVAALLAGSGTAAAEAMLSSLVGAGGRVLVIENGTYGRRLAAIAQAHGISCSVARFEWDEEVPPSRVAAAIDADPSITHLAVVHHETTTGRLNPIEELGQVCRSRGLSLLVDAVSSFGAEEIDFERWGLGACAGSAGKCLHGIPGLAFVVVRRTELQRGCRPSRTVYLDLLRYAETQESGDTPFTPAVHGFFALDEALRELAETGGWRARRRRYTWLAERTRGWLAELGVEPLIGPSESSCVLRSYRLPPGVEYRPLHDRLKQLGFVIYAGQGPLEGEVFRISTMGAIDDADLERFRAALCECLATYDTSLT